MSINKLISIKNAILDATDMAALDHNAYLPLFMTWAVYAEKEIGGMSSITKYAPLDICGCSAVLPCDAVEVEGAILGNHGTNCGGLFNGYWGSYPVLRPVVAGTFMCIDVGGEGPYMSGGSYGLVPYAFQDNKLIFSAGMQHSHVTIQYKGLVEDCDGFPLVCENHIQAITEFILYKWLRRKRKKNQADMREMDWSFKEWDRLCAHARALDNKLTDYDRAEIVAQLHNAYSQTSLSQGIKNT